MCFIYGEFSFIHLRIYIHMQKAKAIPQLLVTMKTEINIVQVFSNGSIVRMNK